MIQRMEEIGEHASATIARWQAEALEIIQERQRASQEGRDYPPCECPQCLALPGGQ